jgi:hypothetical protein
MICASTDLYGQVVWRKLAYMLAQWAILVEGAEKERLMLAQCAILVKGAEKERLMGV